MRNDSPLVTTTTAWCRSRSSRLTAVVCSGRNRPQVEGPVGSDPEGAAFVGGGDEPEQQLGTGVVERGEAEFVDDDQVVAEQVLDDAADGVVGQGPVEGLDEVGGGEVADLVPGVDGGDAERDQDVGLAGAGRADGAGVLRGRGSIPARPGSRRWPSGSRTRRRRTPRGVLMTGNAAWRIRVRALDSSREVISASIRVRRNSSGFHRWVFAVTSSSGARRRIAAELEPPQPGVQVGGQRWRCGAHAGSPPNL